MRLAAILFFVLALAVPACAQLEMFEDQAESSSTQMARPAVAPVAAPKPKPRKSWRRFFPTDTQAWKMQVAASAIVNDRSTWDRLTTTRIKSGKGALEFNLAGSIIGGVYETATLIPWHKLKHRRKAAPQPKSLRESLP